MTASAVIPGLINQCCRCLTPNPQPHGSPADADSAARRAYLVERCTPAAAVLFGAPAAGGQPQPLPDAAATLAGWSNLGLERLFSDLYQVDGWAGRGPRGLQHTRHTIPCMHVHAHNQRQNTQI